MNAPNSETDIRTALSQMELSLPPLAENRFRSDAFAGKTIAAYFFFKTDFSESPLVAYQFSNCRFHKALFRSADLSRAIFVNCLFKETDFSYAQLREARFVHCILEQSDLSGADLLRLSLAHSFMHDIRLNQVVNIGKNRHLAGLFLKQYAGQSAEKHRIAAAIADENIKSEVLEKSIKELPLVYKNWIEAIAQTYPESGLSDSFRLFTESTTVMEQRGEL